MISNREDYIKYLKADNQVNHIGNSFRKKMLITWKYLRCMRKLEYVMNCKHGTWAKISQNWLKLKLYRLSVKAGVTIPPNTFGKGLYLPHHGSVVVNPSAKFGDYCVIQNGVNVSENVVAGNHIYLGAGAKIMIGVHIADNVIVGANTVVTKNVDEENVVVAGIPAKKISENGFLNRKKI